MIRLPHWMRDGKHFIWYRKIRHSRATAAASFWQHHLRLLDREFTWRTR